MVWAAALYSGNAEGDVVLVHNLLARWRAYKRSQLFRESTERPLSLGMLLLTFAPFSCPEWPSVVGETSPSRLATPRHLAIARWRPKFSEKGWRDLAIHPNNPGEIQTFKRSWLTILRREIFEITVSGYSTVPFHWNGVPIYKSLICHFSHPF